MSKFFIYDNYDVQYAANAVKVSAEAYSRRFMICWSIFLNRWKGL